MQGTVNQNDIQRETQTLIDLLLKDGALDRVVEHQLLAQMVLRELDQKAQEVRKTLTGDGRSRNETDGVLGVIVLPVESSIQAPSHELGDDILCTSLELFFGVLGLGMREKERRVPAG